MIYDLIIIGGGPAGYLAAERAGHAGLDTLLIEERAVGGVCLNEGCIPSKTMLYSAKLYDNIRHGQKYGIIAENIQMDHSVVMIRKNKVVKTLVAGIRSKLKANKVTLVEASAKIIPKTADGFHVQTEGSTYDGRRLLIATGSVPVLPPISGLKESLASDFALTNREVLSLERVPASLVIIGGGVIGLEMASYYNSAGSKVTVIEMLDHIAGNTDREISALLLREYAKKGVEFRLNARVTEISKNGVVYEADGKTIRLEAEKALVSIGRKAATEGLGLDNIGVELHRGAIRTDEKGRTNVPEVYAAGDVNGVSMLAHTAYREAEVCIHTILGENDHMRYHAIPSVIYTTPEVASVGETEESAKEKSLEYEVKKLPLGYSGRFVAENVGGSGLCKVLISKRHQRILGVHIMGSYASEIIYGAGLMIETQMRIKDIQELVFPHPTVCEIIRETLF